MTDLRAGLPAAIQTPGNQALAGCKARPLTELADPEVDSLLKQFAQSSQLGANAAWIEDLYEQYLAAPDSVGPKWKAYFDALKGREAGDVPHSAVMRARLGSLARWERWASTICRALPSNSY